MSSIDIIVLLMTGVAALVCYAFIAQTVANKRQQKERLVSALKARVRSFQFMLSGLPPGFLSKDLILLVQRSLMRLYEQLSKLEPEDTSHLAKLQETSQQMINTQKMVVKPEADAVIDNPTKLREVKACLEELYKYIHQLEGRAGMTQQQANSYRNLIKQMVLQIAIDSYHIHSNLAEGKGKFQLAAHYLELGIGLMLREGQNGQFDTKIKKAKSKLETLKIQAAQEKSDAPFPAKKSSQAPEVGKAWDEFAKDDKADWKKKQVYD